MSRSPGDLRTLAARTVVVAAAALAVVSTAALIVVSAEVLLLVFAGLQFSVLLSSAADALVRVSGLRRGRGVGAHGVRARWGYG